MGSGGTSRTLNETDDKKKPCRYLGIVSAVVGAGGNLGAVIGAWSFYKPDYGDDYLLPFRLHSAYVLFWTSRRALALAVTF